MRKIAVVFLVLMVAVMLAVPIASAVPLEEKNNDKFQDFSVTATYSILPYIFVMDHEYIPSVDQVNKLVISGTEPFISYRVTVGTNTYTMGVDFVYTGLIKITFFDPVFANPNPAVGNKYPSSYRATSFMVDYTYDFSAKAGGLDGVLQLRAVSVNGDTHITSLKGTGDFQNVQIKATALPATVAIPLITIYHDGWVIGWPE